MEDTIKHNKLVDIVPEMRKAIRNSTTATYNIYEYVIRRLIKLENDSQDKEKKKTYKKQLRNIQRGWNKNQDFMQILFGTYMSLKCCPECSKGESDE